MPSAQKPAGAEGAERALSRDQPVAADAAAPTPANQGSASAAGAEFTDEDLQQDPLGNGDLLCLGQGQTTNERRRSIFLHLPKKAAARYITPYQESCSPLYHPLASYKAS